MGVVELAIPSGGETDQRRSAMASLPVRRDGKLIGSLILFAHVLGKAVAAKDTPRLVIVDV